MLGFRRTATSGRSLLPTWPIGWRASGRHSSGAVPAGKLKAASGEVKAARNRAQFAGNSFGCPVQPQLFTTCGSISALAVLFSTLTAYLNVPGFVWLLFHVNTRPPPPVG